MEQSLLQWISQYGYAGIFFLLMFGIIGVPIPDETLLTFPGYLVFKGQLQIGPTMISAFLGSICGITISYLLGRTGGHALILRYGNCLHISLDTIDRVHEWLECRGRWGLFRVFHPGGEASHRFCGWNITNEVFHFRRICILRRTALDHNIHNRRLLFGKRMGSSGRLNPAMDSNCNYPGWLCTSCTHLSCSAKGRQKKLKRDCTTLQCSFRMSRKQEIGMIKRFSPWLADKDLHTPSRLHIQKSRSRPLAPTGKVV